MHPILQSVRYLAALAFPVAAVSCGAPVDHTEPGETTPDPSLALQSASVHGGGHYAINDLIVQLALNAKDQGGGSARGNFHHKTSYDGLTADFTGEVTCLAVDPANSRAWIGGVVTKNASTDPDYAAPIYQAGRDIWFRVVDYDGAKEDRTTFVGFEGAAGIITSAEYCVRRIWPDADARTWPVTTGNISVKP